MRQISSYMDTTPLPRLYEIECHYLAYKVTHECPWSDATRKADWNIGVRSVQHYQQLSTTTKRHYGDPGDSIRADLHVSGHSGRLGHILVSTCIQLCTCGCNAMRLISVFWSTSCKHTVMCQNRARFWHIKACVQGWRILPTGGLAAQSVVISGLRLCRR